MLHGHPGNGAAMEVFAAALSDRYWAIAPDLRGYGRSRTSHSFVMTDHLSDLEALLAKLDIDRFWVLG
ncbi:MAG: alpha/beta fold hydrolase, partial [Cyanobacteria bacterium J06639_1]